MSLTTKSIPNRHISGLIGKRNIWLIQKYKFVTTPKRLKKCNLSVIRFRCHPQLAFPYEKYDKSKDCFVYCACCTAKNTDAVHTFRNIQIQVNAGKWVIVSKSNAPAIHFVMKYPKMIRAFEDFCRPEIKP